METSQFDDIRPYNVEEIPAAMQRIAFSSSFPFLASYVYPDEPLETVRERIANYKTVREFQTETMRMVNQRVIKNSRLLCDLSIDTPLSSDSAIISRSSTRSMSSRLTSV